MLPRRKVPPGLPETLRRGAVNFSPVAAVLLLGRLLRVMFDFKLPAIVVALTVIASVPAFYMLRLVAHRRRVRRAAKRAGAVLPPEWNGEKFGNRDLLVRAIERFQNGYIGDGFWDKIDELGHLHAITIYGDTAYITNDANVVKTVLATDFQDFEKGEDFRDNMNSVLGTGVFNVDGEMWKFHRMMTRPYFSRDRISHFELFDRHTALAIQKIRERFRGGHAVDFQDVISRFTLDSATEFLFGACVNSLHSDLPYAYNDAVAPQFARAPNVAERFSAAFAGAQNVISMRTRVGWFWHLQELLNDRSAEHMRVVDEFLQPILEEAIAKNRAAKAQLEATGEKGSEEDETLLDHLVKLTDDPVVLHDETLNILIAGRDTTAATLTFVVYLMSLYPHVFQRLRAEVMEKVGPSQMPSFDDVRNMKYLRAVINETLRLYPIVPFNVRVATRDTTLPNPDPSAPRVFIPKGTAQAYSVFLMHRRKDYWGPDALDFDPDRWLDERLNKYFTANPFIFVPFNAGPRICLGQQFAYNEMSFFLIRLLQNFSHVELDLSAQPPDARPPAEWASAEGQKGREQIIPKCHLTLYVLGGLWVKMTEAERDA
ncbi:cytochrome P450 monooxygenase pc-3 [Trametes versicolor FP-101664 SS1]|uniref:cytochrome P450 monooxygenase pc-3 n=1 Tax=Trametes versicolor (strain FP-101664) TaxID=717944 RepID=UPI0004624755|nr:cytochrome P450 monooxygenase pc-3 [Trametes versicolor FP-101664 SS1]EIW61469.1 cytochrome P450 monooxygenase pc-3 [Trametes versicolor FP-101664 SS1]